MLTKSELSECPVAPTAIYSLRPIWNASEERGKEYKTMSTKHNGQFIVPIN